MDHENLDTIQNNGSATVLPRQATAALDAVSFFDTALHANRGFRSGRLTGLDAGTTAPAEPLYNPAMTAITKLGLAKPQT